MTRTTRAIIITFGAAGLLLALGAAPGSAHEGRKVGRYLLHVGFGDEPAYSGDKNSVQVLIHDAATDKPVVDLGDTLKVDVSQGSDDTAKMSMALEPDFEVGEFGTPGDYRAFFIPTVPGAYTFHFTGTIKGQRIDQRFTSGPQTFSEVKDPAEVQFPAREPTTGQLATRLDRETQRLNQAVAAGERRAKDQAGTARLIAIIGLVAGALGLVTAGVFGLGRRA
ncbi:MAG TPA: hypothetical protein VFA46_06865 [Actinomycetes bacterium]|jgi:hypothetical protein|nr:hypothetical protein [Actinomycetes bacterium]